MTRIIRFPGVMSVPSDHPKFHIPSIIDDFNRPNGALNGTATTVGGKIWNTWSALATIKIMDGQVSMADATVSAPVTVTVASNNYEVQATLSAVGSTAGTSGGGLLVRSSPPNSFAWLSTRISGTATGYRFWQSLGGVNTAIGTSYSVTPKVGDVLKVRAEGSTLTGWVNGVLACAATTDVTTGANIGFLAHPQGAGTRWDGFSAAEL